MKLILTPLLAVVGAAALALPTVAQPAKSDTPCIYTRDLRNHTVGDSHTLYFDVGGRSVYRVETSNSCLSTASSSDAIIMRTFTGSPQICRPMDLDIQVNSQRCLIKSLTKLTPAEVAALPKKMKP